jgi:flagellar biosynthesis protein FlhG
MYELKDQASRLRTLAKDLDVTARSNLYYDQNPRRVFDFMVTSGKSGVGKTNLIISLAIAIAQWKKKVLLVDMDFTSNTLPYYFDMNAEAGLYELLKYDLEIKDIILSHETGVDILVNHTDILTDFQMNQRQRTRIIRAIDRVSSDYDYIIADCQGGINQNTKFASELSKKLLFVSTSDPISVIDSYSLMKYLLQHNTVEKMECIINRVKKKADFEDAVEKIDTALINFLGLTNLKYHRIDESRLLTKRMKNNELTQHEDKYLPWAKEIRRLLKRISD